jgi:small subunit ribosomal protein S6
MMRKAERDRDERGGGGFRGDREGGGFRGGDRDGGGFRGDRSAPFARRRCNRSS